MLRLFVAVPVPLELAARAAALIPDGAALRPVRPELMHLTLAFLGWVDEARLDDAAAAVAAAAAAGAPARVSLGATGRFPPSGRPRVLWLGLTEGAAELGLLGEGVRTELRARSLPFDDRPFAPHLTLARVRDDADRDDLAVAASAFAAATVPDLAFEAREAHLMRSVLGRAGPRYSSAAAYRLGG